MNELQSPTSRAGSLPNVGGVLALDFCNTSSGRGTEGHRDHLGTVQDLLAWAGSAAVINAETQALLRRRFAGRAGAHLLDRALRLRDALYRLSADLARGRPPNQDDTDAVAGTHAACLAKGRLHPKDGAFGWSWSVDEAPEEAILGPIASSAMMLITAADRARLKQCDGHHCGWLFLDTTKSNNRRWCEMEVCGNRAKQKRRAKRPGPA